MEAGASARTSGQGSELLRLPSGQQLLLSRPNGQPTRAGQFYYQLAGRRAPSRRFNENQQLVRDGPNDYIYLRGGTKKLVRSLQPDGNYRVTKLGKSFFRDKWTEYLAHMPVRIRGRRRNGRPYERETLLPVTLDGLGRQNDSLGEVQAHRNVIAAALRKMGDPEDGAVVMEISEETYTYDASRDWAVSKQTMQVVDNRVETEVALNRRLGVLRDVSYQLFRGSEILQSAFEQREDRLCVVRQLSELLRLPCEEVYSDFDAICPKNWERKGVTGAEIREFCAWRKAPLYIVNCRGQMLDCYEPAVREQRPVACCIYRDHAFFYRNAGAVSFCDGEARDQPSYRGDRRESTVPLFRVEAVGRRDRARALLVRGRGRGPGRAAGAGAPAEGRDARLGGVAVPAPEGQGRRLRRPRVSRRRGGAREVDDQAGLRLPGPAPGRGRQRGLRRALEGAPGPGAAAGAAGALRSVRHAHRSEGEEHMAKLAVNALIGLWARSKDVFYSMRTSNHEVDGRGCQYQQVFFDDRGQCHYDHVYATELRSMRPAHDFVMASEYVEMARIHLALREVPPRYLVAMKTDCLVYQSLPRKFVHVVEALTRRRHRDNTPKYRFEEVKRLEGEYQEPRLETEPPTEQEPWRHVEDPVEHCLNGHSLLLSGMPGTGKTHLARQIVSQLPRPPRGSIN